jgi:hypothetical protein
MTRYDPWGPISAALYEENNSDLVQTVVDYTGISIPWPAAGYSHATRIRDFRHLIQGAYTELADEEKGRFAQIAAKHTLASGIRPHLKQKMLDGLNDIGWALSDEGNLVTQDALLSEQFFPPGAHYDAYIAIRSILEEATIGVLIVDAYMGSTLFATLRASPHAAALSVQLLTTDKNLKADFTLEADKFRKQFTAAKFEVRTTQDFHDRFVVVDGTQYYHVGASIKDAGKRAFLISRLQDQSVITLMKQHIDSAWNSATTVL